MKTKTFLLACLLVGIGLTKITAQDGNRKLNNTDVTKYINVPGWVPVSCDGVHSLDLYGMGNATVLVHYSDGVPQWVKGITYGFTGTMNTGESFKGRELDKSVEIFSIDPATGYLTMDIIWSGVLVGDWGTHIKYKILMKYFPDGSASWSFLEVKCF
jgi:hypothetical protein